MTATPPAPLVLRRSAGDRWNVIVMAALVGLMLAMLGWSGAIIGREGETAAAVFLAVIALLMAGSLYLLLSEAIIRWRTRITLEYGVLSLKLPRRRGFVPAPAVDRSIPWAAIKGVETRLEAFRALGTTVLQRAHALVLDEGTRLLLGADRRMVAPYYAGAAEAIAKQAGLTLRDLGTVEGRPGMLMVWGQSVPPWDTPSLPEALAERKIRQERFAWTLLWAVLGLAALAVALSKLL